MAESVYAIATMDTKGQELAFLASRLRAAGVKAVIIDVGTLAAPHWSARRHSGRGHRQSSRSGVAPSACKPR